MSVAAMNWALEQRDVPPAERFVLLVLANFADAGGRCWPSQAALAEKTGYPGRSIKRYLARLAAAGKLGRERSVRGDGRFGGTVYRLGLLPPAPEYAPDDAAPGATMAPGDGPGPGATMAPGPGAKTAATRGQNQPHQGPMVAPGKNTVSLTVKENRQKEPSRTVCAREAGAAPKAPASAHTNEPQASAPADQPAAGAGPLSDGQRARLESVLGRGEFAAWFEGCLWDAGRRALLATSAFRRDYIAVQFGGRIAEAFGGKVEVQVQAGAPRG